MRQGTRIVLLTACLGASVVMLLMERQKSIGLADDLADLTRITASQVSELQQEISNARSNAENLELALSQTREQVARSDDRHRSDEAVTKDAAAKLQADREQAAAFSDKLADTERRAALQATEIQRRLEAQQAKAAALDRELKAARQQLTTTDERQRSAEATARDAETASQAQRQQAAALADKLAETEHRSAAEAKKLQERIEAEQARASGLERDLAQARVRIAEAAKLADDLRDARISKLGPPSEADRLPAVNQRQTEAPLPAEPTRKSSGPESEPTPPAPPAQTQTSTSEMRVPPEEVPARIVLRYASGSESAKARAQSAEVLLLAQGLRIEDHASPAKGVSASRVIFYYKEDQAIAESIAGALARITRSDTIQKPLMSLKPLPRPGTIEVAISG